MNTYTLVSTFWSDNKIRRAEIHKDPEEGLSVHLYDHDQLKEVRHLNNYSIHYAEDCAENYVMGIFNAKVQLNS